MVFNEWPFKSFFNYGFTKLEPVVDGKIQLKENLKVWCGTWNMGDAPPNWYDDPLGDWMPKGQDIYAIATQV